jgi:hypothetical protein
VVAILCQELFDSGASTTVANRAHIHSPSNVQITAQKPGLSKLAGSFEISTQSVASRPAIQKVASLNFMFERYLP